MGGVAGHMDHLYDNRNLTFEKMKEIMLAGADAELSTEEKVDGQNLFLSYSVPEGKAKGARNKGHYRSGGLDASGLAKKFAGRGGLERAFTGGFNAFERAAESLSDEEKEKIFGPDTNIWYNAEIMDPGTDDDPGDPGSVNVIKYDNKTLKIHNVGHFVYNPESGETENIPPGALETLDNALEKMQKSLQDHDFSLARKAIIQLKKLENQEPIKEAFARINTALAAEDLSDSSTVGDYVFSRLVNGVDTNLSDKLKEELAKYLMGHPDNIGKRALKKGLKKEDQQDIDNIIRSKSMILREAILPIELAVHDYTVEILKGLKSVFIADTDKEVNRLKSLLSKAVKDITEKGPEDPATMEVMQFHLNKIKDFSQITTPVEAVVFDYDGHTYKFAGNFAPLNQILGMYRYPKSRKTTTESVNRNITTISEKNGKRVALIPGGFKPPHAGHFLLAKYFSDKKDVDEVIVIVSKKSRPPVDVDMSVKLWDLYIRDFPKIKVQPGTTASPVGDVYELIADNSVFKDGDVVLLGKSEKDTDDTRFDRAQSYAERKNPGVGVESVITPLFAGGVSGTQMRSFISTKDKSSFIKNLPKHLEPEQKEQAYSIVADTVNEKFNIAIDDALEEISTMSGGAVEIGSAPFGYGNKTNSYNPYARKKRKKPKINRAKRQRRR
tara:strand:- start:1294 stop:3297 length:2004 start_codon:yes stop_codon:yes gene_type:complete